MTDNDKLLSDLSALVQEYREENKKVRDSIPLLPLCNNDDTDEVSFQKGQLSVMVYLADVLGISLVFYDLRKGFIVDEKFCEQCKKEQESEFRKEAFNKYRKSINACFKKALKINIKKRKKKLKEERKRALKEN